jgi:hypothetical protein
VIIYFIAGMKDNMRVHARYLDDVCATGMITVIPKWEKKDDTDDG